MNLYAIIITILEFIIIPRLDTAMLIHLIVRYTDKTRIYNEKSNNSLSLHGTSYNRLKEKNINCFCMLALISNLLIPCFI